MKRFLKFYRVDKENIKMINQASTGFELVVLSDTMLKELLEVINTCEEQNDELAIVWQMKFKPNNYILYKNCTFSAPMDNFHTPRTTNRWGQVNEKTPIESPKMIGKKLKVTCSGVSFYSESAAYKDQGIKNTRDKYKDATLLNRMLKIGQLNLKSVEKIENLL
jgi:hypothetical protein